MHLFSRRNASLALSLAAVGVLAACGDDVIVPLQPPTPVTISITPQAVTLNPGQTGTLSVQISGGSPTPTLATCASATPAVATAVAAGSVCTVTAVASGNTTVTATTSAGQSASAAVSVNQLPAALGELTITPSMNNLVGGQTVQLVPNPNRASTGVTVAFQYTSSSPSVASVNASGLVTAGTVGNAVITVQATGTGTGFSSATRTTTATVNVLSAPAGVTSLTASPSSLALATSGTGSVAASVLQPTGAPAAVLTFGTTNPAVATVAVSTTNPNLATVTAVSQGTATITVTATSPAGQGFSASTLTQLVSVTVAPAAQVSIGNITSAQTNNPVDITNVSGQIQVPLNITTNGQNVQSAQVFVCLVGEAVPACAARNNGVPAAQQTFGAAGANTGIINMFINTAEFTVDADLANATVRHTNGQKILVATLTVAGQATVANNNLSILNFNNMDGFAARHTPPARSDVNASTNTTFFGGPGAEGRGSVTVVPVIYTEGRTISRVTVGLTGACATSRSLTFVTGTDSRPWRYTYGYSVSTSTSTATQNSANDAAFNITCRSQSDGSVDPDVAPRILSSIDNSQNAGPAVAMATNFRTSTSNSPAILTPASIRVDYVGPAVSSADITRSRPAVTGWVNASFDFNANTAASTDAGVGVEPNSRSFSYNGCTTTTSSARIAMPNSLGESVPVCATNATGGWNATDAISRGPYRVFITELDRLDNSSESAASALFGTDFTAPAIRFAASSIDDTAKFNTNAPGTVLTTEFLDERSGFIDQNFDLGAPLYLSNGSLSPLTAADRSQRHFATRAAGNYTATTTKSQCINPNAITNILLSSGAISTGGSAFQTNPNCSFSATGVANVSGTTADGFRVGHSVSIPSEGIYHYATRVSDRAGNESEIIRRRWVQDGVAPELVAVNAPTGISASSPLMFQLTAQDNVEVRAVTPALNIPGLGITRYSQQLVDATFNDLVNSPIAQSVTVGATGAPYLLGASSSFTGIPGVLASVSAQVADPLNRFSALVTANIPSQSIGTLTAAFSSTSPYTSWMVEPDRAAGSNAPEGLKARLISSTEVSSPFFTRVDFFRRSAAGADASFTPLHFQYLGSVQASAVASADVGDVRTWTFTLADADYANLPSDFGQRQSAAACQEGIIAVGVRGNGAGVTTAVQTLCGPAPTGIALTITGLPAGAPGSVTISDGGGFNQTVTSSGTYTVPNAGTYFITAQSTSFNSQNFAPTVATANQTVTVVANASTPVTVNYALAATRISVTVSGLFGAAAGQFTIAGTGGNSYTQLFTLGNGVNSINVPQAGIYNITAVTPQTIALDNYTVAVGTPSVTVTAGAAPSTTTVVFSNTTPRVSINAIAPLGVAPNIALNCNAGAFTATQTATGSITYRPGAGNEACVITANAVVIGTDIYIATIGGAATPAGLITATLGNPAPSATVTYVLASPTLTVRSVSIGGGINNLPNGIAYSVRVSGNAFSAQGGFRDFPAVTGTDLVITAADGLTEGTYNISFLNSLSLNTQLWGVAAVGNVASTGGRVVGIPNLVAPNVVIQNIEVGRATVPANSVATDFASLNIISWTGPQP